MAEFIHEHSTGVKSEDGTTYIVRIYGQERIHGTWEGWLEFHPTDKRKSVLRTDAHGTRDVTAQPHRHGVLGVWFRADLPRGGLRTRARTIAVATPCVA